MTMMEDLHTSVKRFIWYSHILYEHKMSVNVHILYMIDVWEYLKGELQYLSTWTLFSHVFACTTMTFEIGLSENAAAGRSKTGLRCNPSRRLHLVKTCQLKVVVFATDKLILSEVCETTLLSGLFFFKSKMLFV